MTSRRQFWVRFLAVGTLLSVGVMAIAGAVLYARLVSKRTVTPEVADAELDALLTQFRGQQPLVEFIAADRPVVHRRPSARRRPVVSLQVLAYSPDDAEMTRVTLPGWLVRWLAARGTNLLDVSADDPLTIEDIERHGPGLLMHVRGSALTAASARDTIFGSNIRGARVIVFAD
jgi:hypothetical protein